MNDQAKTATQVWENARHLAELAEDEKAGDARTFLAQSKNEKTSLGASYRSIVRGKADLRNPQMREILEAYKKWKNAPRISSQENKRASLGDPTKPPRAGAPKMVIHSAPGLEEFEGLVEPHHQQLVTYELLEELNEMVRKHGDAGVVIQGLASLMHLKNTEA